MEGVPSASALYVNMFFFAGEGGGQLVTCEQYFNNKVFPEQH